VASSHGCHLFLSCIDVDTPPGQQDHYLYLMGNKPIFKLAKSKHITNIPPA